MKKQSLKDLMAWLRENHTFLHKSLSQNFLIDHNIVQKIIQISHVNEKDTVLEIGPGFGILTYGLLENKAHVIAVEKDQKFATRLLQQHVDGSNLEVVEGDFLQECDTLFEKINQCKVIANIPYKITSPIIEKLCKYKNKILSATLMVQEEFGVRVCAKKGKASGIISHSTQFHFHTKIMHKVSKNCFYPSPKIDSCILQLIPKEDPYINFPPFHTFLRNSFGMRRKKLISNLKNMYDPIQLSTIFKTQKLPETVRAEELSLEQLINLFAHIDPLHSPISL